MDNLQTYLESGNLELYVLGAGSEEERREVEQWVATHPAIQEEVLALQAGLENALLESTPAAAPSTIRKKVFSLWDELEQDTSAATPPLLNPNSHPEDYSQWLESDDIQPPAEYDNIFYIPLNQDEVGLTAMVWMKEGSPEEVHHDQIEKFLIVEGTCQIRIQDTIHHLKPGSYLSIPLHLPHEVTVTSETPCKIVLQRLAA